ncbi:MAG TPA: hypothetical protein VHZ95_07175, partial [Polyangiales bacterium]|nr:hypothetical protein [Polyangiales bacterium]
MRLPLMAAAASVVFSVGHVDADDAVASGRATNLIPLTASELVLKSETVELEFAPKEQAWQVSAHYE